MHFLLYWLEALSYFFTYCVKNTQSTTRTLITNLSAEGNIKILMDNSPKQSENGGKYLYKLKQIEMT